MKAMAEPKEMLMRRIEKTVVAKMAFKGTLHPGWT